MSFLELTDLIIDDSNIIGAYLVSQSHIWRNNVLGSWGLAVPPKASDWFEDDYDDNEMSGLLIGRNVSMIGVPWTLNRRNVRPGNRVHLIHLLQSDLCIYMGDCL
jgi:hypothetical protein